MTRSRCTFRETDVKRAIRAVEAAGKTVYRAEIDPDGRIVIVVAEPAATVSQTAYERWRASDAHQA